MNDCVFQVVRRRGLVVDGGMQMFCGRTVFNATCTLPQARESQLGTLKTDR